MVGLTHIICRFPHLRLDPDKGSRKDKKSETYALQKRIPTDEELDEFIKLTESLLEDKPSEDTSKEIAKKQVDLKA